MSRYTERLARSLERPIVAACAVRPPATTLAIALGAGAGAAIGGITGVGPFLAAAGVFAGYLVLWLATRGSGRTLGMALVLEDDHVELLQMSALGSRPVRTLRSIAYADIVGVDTRDRFLELRIEIRTRTDALVVTGGKHGVGAVPPVIDELRRRIAA